MDRNGLTSEEIDLLLTPTDQGFGQEQPARQRHVQDMLGELDAGTMAALEEMHEQLGAALETSFCQQMGCDIQVRLSGLSRETYSQFVFARPIPTCFAVIDAQPLDATFALDISPSVLFPLLDRLLGSAEPAPPAQRPLTEIETRLGSRIVRSFLAHYRDSWEHILSLDLQIDRFEHNPQQVRLFPGSEPILFARFKLRAGPAFGHIDWCVPTNAIRHMAGRLHWHAGRLHHNPSIEH